MARVKFRQNCKGKMPDGKKIYPSECDMPDTEARKFITYGMADEVSALAFVETEDSIEESKSREFFNEVASLKAKKQVKALLADWGMGNVKDIPDDCRADFLDAVKTALKSLTEE